MIATASRAATTAMMVRWWIPLHRGMVVAMMIKWLSKTIQVFALAFIGYSIIFLLFIY